MIEQIRQTQSKLQEICRRHGIRRLEIFGSATRDDFRPDSDLDFLVEFEVTPALSGYFRLKEELESLFGRQVDLVMLQAVRNPYVRAAIERDRQLLYAA
jgi:predicted nucleotidyltransferase